MVVLVIRSGMLVTPEGRFEGDVVVARGKIAALCGPGVWPESAQEIDARGMFVLPGLVDAHVHLGPSWRPGLDCFANGTRAALLGGTTTVVDFAVQRGHELPTQAVERDVAAVEGAGFCDYGFHSVITHVSDDVLSDMVHLIAGGVPTVKCFMTYPEQGLMVSDGDLLRVIQSVKRAGGMFGAHAECNDVAEMFTRLEKEQGNVSPAHHALAKPPIVESLAVNRVLEMASECGAAYYNFHLSCLEGLNAIAAARSSGKPVYAETCTHYLVLNSWHLSRDGGRFLICSPPLRSFAHVEALWQGLANGAVSVVASDECMYSIAEKAHPCTPFYEVPNGVNGLEFRLQVVFSEGVVKKRFDMNRLVDVLSKNPARLMGLYPRKGSLQVGADADIVVFDPTPTATLRPEDTATGLGWHAFSGLSVRGKVRDVVLRGHHVVAEGVHVGAAVGEYQRRALAPEDVTRRML